MITKNIVNLPKSEVEVTITVPWSDLEAKWNQNLQKMADEVEMPGFRKGQAPLPVVEQNLGSKVADEFFKVVFPGFLVEALQGSNIVPIDYPKYQLISFSKGQPLSYKATITGRPEVKVGDYKSITAPRPALKTVTDEDTNKIIDDLYKRWKAKQPVAAAPQPAPIQAGATSQPAGGAGSLSFNQPNQDVSNTQVLADTPDDTFAKALGTQSLIDLKTKIKADLENEAKTNNELDYEEAILQQVEKITTVDIPEILVADELNRMLISLQQRVSEMGLLLEDYLKSQNKTVEGVKAEWRPQAERNVRMELGLAEVARQEKVDITDSELQAEIDKIQDAKLKARFEAEEPRLHLRHSLRQMKTLDLLKKVIKA